MNIYNYIDEYSIYSFDEYEFNDIDAAIFSFISYANLKEIMEKDRLKIKDIGRMHLGLYTEKDKNIIAVKDANKLIRYIKDTKRYKDCIVHNYEYIGNDDLQFCALAIDYQRNKTYISFEGTNELISGWKEDFILSYEFPTKSHQAAIDYLNKHFTFTTRKLIVGGHSKGGNLALVASMKANMFVRAKVKKVYSFDGPGVLENEYNSKEYKKVLKKYVHYIPDYSIVGLLLKNSNNVVVKTSTKGILAHDILYWQVEEDHFVNAQLAKVSKELDKRVDKWFEKYNDEDKQDFIDNLDIVMTKAGITSLLELKESSKNVINLLKETKEINAHNKKIINEFISIVIDCLVDIKKEEIKELLNKQLFEKDKK